MTRIIITGSRSWECHALADKVIARLIDRYGADDLIIVEGEQKGVDLTFRAAAERAGLYVEPHPARWGNYGDNAGPMRNREMVRAGATLCIGVHNHIAVSRGTRNCISQAFRASIPCYLIESETGEPRLIKNMSFLGSPINKGKKPRG